MAMVRARVSRQLRNHVCAKVKASNSISGLQLGLGSLRDHGLGMVSG